MKEEEFFEEYTSQYDKTLPGIALKYNHSFRVVEKALIIAEDLNLTLEDMELVRVCALLHDIARFEQYKEFNSFDDKKTFDHGDKEVEILKENGYNNEIVLNSVKYHNKLEIPNNLDSRNKLFLKIVRDADKVDILQYQGYNCETNDYTISKELIDFFKKHKSIGQDIKEKPQGNIVGLLRMLAFIFDLNYKSSFKMVKDLDLINRKCDIIRDHKIDGIEEIRKICNEYIESRI